MLRLVLFRVLESYFRHRWLYFVPVLLMAAFAGLGYVRAKPVYISRGAFYVQKATLLASLTALSQEGFSWVTPAEQTVDEIKELMQTDAFVRAMIQKTNLEKEMEKGSAAAGLAFANVRRSVWSQTLGNNLVMVGASYGDAETAEQLSRALLEAYLLWRINSDQQESATAQQFFAGLVQKYQTDLNNARADLKTYLDQNPDPVRGERTSSEKIELDRLQGMIDLYSKQLVSAIEKEEDARLNMSKTESDVRQKYYTIDAPRLPTTTENSKRQAAINAAIYVVIGVVLAIVAIIVAALLDTALRFPVDVRHGLSLPVLASIPEPKPPKRAKAKK